jgi:hypothetical protein
LKPVLATWNFIAQFFCSLHFYDIHAGEIWLARKKKIAAPPLIHNDFYYWLETADKTGANDNHWRAICFSIIIVKLKIEHYENNKNAFYNCNLMGRSIV